MADDKPKLTRRRVLGSMATVGVAGAMGAGSWAYFNDEESITDNTLAAGELDLALSWTKSYHGSRTGSYYGDTGSGDGPIFDLHDVKPGDWGEATIEMDVIGNAARIFLNGDITDRAENGRNEPEKKVDGDSGGELDNKIKAQVWNDINCNNRHNEGDTTTKSEPLDVVIVFDRSGSMGGEIGAAKNGAVALINALGSNDQVGVVSFASNAGTGSSPSNTSPDQGLTLNKTAAEDAITNLSAGGSTNMEAATELAHEELLQGEQFDPAYDGSGNARTNARGIMVFLGDGAPTAESDITDSNSSPVQEADNAKTAGIEIYTIAYGTSEGSTADDLLEAMASGSSYSYNADVSNVVDVFEDISKVVSGGEKLLARGTLNHVMAVLNDLELDGPMGNGCFSPGGRHCLGFEWWLPEKVGNEVQTDSVMFDLSFRAEQCRHNPAQRSNHDHVPS